jgi:hypothetical protein
MRARAGDVYMDARQRETWRIVLMENASFLWISPQEASQHTVKAPLRDIGLTLAEGLTIGPRTLFTALPVAAGRGAQRNFSHAVAL